MAARLTIETDRSVVLSAERIGFRRGERTILDDASIDVRAGERVSVLGPSGAGKSTLLRLLAGLERPTTGHIRPEIRPGERDAQAGVRVGLLFQDLGLFPHMRVRGNVAFALLARGVARRERRRRADEALAQAGLAGYGDRFPSTLSGGERQRVAIVRMMLSEPAVLLLDEPFAALDPHLVDQFAEWLGDVQRRSRISIILVTHDVELAMRWSDRLAILHEGAMAQTGPPAKVYGRPESAFVATFLGRANVVAAVVTGGAGDGRVTCRPAIAGGAEVVATAAAGLVTGARCRLVIRPQHLRLSSVEDDGAGPVGAVERVEFAKVQADVVVSLADGGGLRVGVDGAAGQLAARDPVRVAWPPISSHAVPW